MRALVLAAGYGTRLARDIAADTSGRFASLAGLPKPLLPIGGIPLLSRWVLALKADPAVTGIHVVINDFYKDKFEAWAAEFPEVQLLSDGTMSNETRMGAVACIKFAIDHFGISGEDVLVIGGDTLYYEDLDLSKLLAGFRQQHRVAGGPNDASLILGYSTDDKGTSKHGIIEMAADRRATAFLEKPGPAGTTSRLACPCTYLLSPRATGLLGQFLTDKKDCALEERDAPGNFLRFLIPLAPVLVETISGRFDVGGLDTYISCDEYFHQLKK